MKYLITLLSILLFQCSLDKTINPEDIICYEPSWKQTDSVNRKFDSEIIPDYLPRPELLMWEYWDGSPWYRNSDTTLIAYGEIIISMGLTGWINQYGDTSKNWNLNGTDGIMNNNGYQVPYFKDSVQIIRHDLDKREPISYEATNCAPFWYPTIFPPYIHWRIYNGGWLNNWYRWPECPLSKNGHIAARLDADKFIYGIGDTVSIVDFHSPNYMMNTLICNFDRGGICWMEDFEDIFNKYYFRLRKDIIAEAVVIDEWIFHGIRYYRVEYLDNSGRRVHVIEEFSVYRKQINWNEGGSEEYVQYK